MNDLITYTIASVAAANPDELNLFPHRITKRWLRQRIVAMRPAADASYHGLIELAHNLPGCNPLHIHDVMVESADQANTREQKKHYASVAAVAYSKHNISGHVGEECPLR